MLLRIYVHCTNRFGMEQIVNVYYHYAKWTTSTTGHGMRTTDYGTVENINMFKKVFIITWMIHEWINNHVWLHFFCFINNNWLLLSFKRLIRENVRRDKNIFNEIQFVLLNCCCYVCDWLMHCFILSSENRKTRGLVVRVSVAWNLQKYADAWFNEENEDKICVI